MECKTMKGKVKVLLMSASILLVLSLTGCSWMDGILNDEEASAALEGEPTAVAQATDEDEGQSSQSGDGEGLASQPGEDDPPPQGAGQQGNTPAQGVGQAQNQGGTPPAQNAGQESCTNKFALDGSSNIAPGEEFDAGDVFQVDWPIKNTGTCTWTTDYALAFFSGDQLGAPVSIALSTSIDPGDSIVLSVEMTAPSQPDEYISFWKLQDGDGQLFGMETPSNAGLRVKIEVVQSAGNPSNSMALAVPEIALGNLPNILSVGIDETMLEGQCFDLVEGEEVSCNDPAADIRYTYSVILGGYLHATNGTLFSDLYESAPGESTCEAEAYSGTPIHLTSLGNYACLQTEYDGDTVYGWIKPTSNNSGGLTFSYLLWEPDTTMQLGEAIPAAYLLFSLEYGTGQTLLIDKCFDLVGGEKAACNGTAADIKYIDSSGQKSVQTLGDTAIGIGVSSEEDPPTKTECQAKDYMEGYVYLPSAENCYVCVRTDYGSETVYGWYKVTSFNSGGMTFDYLIWEP
jgi:hypothetical protein